MRRRTDAHVVPEMRALLQTLGARFQERLAELKRWQVEIINQNQGEHGGYKEIIARIIGQGAYSQLKFESGAHRVQRVPETE